MLCFLMPEQVVLKLQLKTEVMEKQYDCCIQKRMKGCINKPMLENCNARHEIQAVKNNSV